MSEKNHFYKNNEVNKPSSMQARPFTFMRFTGLRRSILISNKCNHRAKIIISPTPIGHVTKIGINGITGNIGANVEIQRDKDKKSIEVLAPNVSRKMNSHTSSSYITILIEINSEWKLLRKDKLINNWRQTYSILQRNIIECVDIQ